MYFIYSLKSFDGGIVGKAMRGAMCVLEFSGGINSHTKSIGLLALRIAQQMGYNFGMDHDYKYDGNCRCRGKHCFMWAYRTYPIPTGWSICSIDSLKSFLSTGTSFCLR